VIGQHLKAGAHFGRQLARVVDVDAHPKGMIFLQHRAELGRNSLGEENRHAGTDAEKLDVLDRTEPAENFFQLLVAEEECVAAGQAEITRLGLFFEIFEGGLEFGVQLLFAYTADDTGAGAISAIARNDRSQEKHAIRVTMHEAGHGMWNPHHRVRHVVGRSPGFLDPRDDLRRIGQSGLSPRLD
jgi:hypothetical protein